MIGRKAKMTTSQAITQIIIFWILSTTRSTRSPAIPELEIPQWTAFCTELPLFFNHNLPKKL
jgi:hypothetical protein